MDSIPRKVSLFWTSDHEFVIHSKAWLTRKGKRVLHSILSPGSLTRQRGNLMALKKEGDENDDNEKTRILGKLAEFGTNIASPRGHIIAKTPNPAEENEYKTCHKYQRLCGTSEIKTPDEGVTNVFQETQLESVPEVSGNESEKPEEDISDEYSVYNVERIKEADGCSGGIDTLWYNTDYIEDIIYHEMHKESLYQLSGTFCRKYDINPTGREILIDWLISVQVSVKAENSVLHLAVALLDILLDSMHVPLSGMQAAAIAAFWVAYKFIHGGISMKTLLSFCAGTVTKTMIRENEILVLQTSQLLEAGGSVTVFFNYFLYNIFGAKFPPEIYYCGLYFIEIMLIQFMFVDCPAYEKAAAAVFTALSVHRAVGRFDFINVSRFITKRRLQQVCRRLMRSLKLMYYNRSTLKNSSVYIKYKSSRYCRISAHQNLKCLANA